MSMGLASVPIPLPTFRFELAPAPPVLEDEGGGLGDAAPERMRAASCANSALQAEQRTRRLPMKVGGTWYSWGEAHLSLAREEGGLERASER